MRTTGLIFTLRSRFLKNAALMRRWLNVTQERCIVVGAETSLMRLEAQQIVLLCANCRKMYNSKT